MMRKHGVDEGNLREHVNETYEYPEGKAMVPKWLSYTPLGRMAKLTDLQGAVVFLASEVSDFITGIDILIDGGYTLW